MLRKDPLFKAITESPWASEADLNALKCEQSRLHQVDENGWTLLMHAIKAKNLCAVKWVILNAGYMSGTPHIISRQSNRADGHQFALKLAVENLSFNPQSTQFEEKLPALPAGGKRGDAVAIVEFLLGYVKAGYYRIDINMTDVAYNSAFTVLAGLPGDNLAILEKFIALKPNPLKALFNAIQAGNVAIVNRLLDIEPRFAHHEDVFVLVNKLHGTQPDKAKQILISLMKLAKYSPSSHYREEKLYPRNYFFFGPLLEEIQKNNVPLYMLYIEVCLNSREFAHGNVSSGNFPLIQLLKRVTNYEIAAHLLKLLLNDEYRDPKTKKYSYYEYCYYEHSEEMKVGAALLKLAKQAAEKGDVEVLTLAYKFCNENASAIYLGNAPTFKTLLDDARKKIVGQSSQPGAALVSDEKEESNAISIIAPGGPGDKKAAPVLESKSEEVVDYRQQLAQAEALIQQANQLVRAAETAAEVQVASCRRQLTELSGGQDRRAIQNETTRILASLQGIARDERLGAAIRDSAQQAIDSVQPGRPQVSLANFSVTVQRSSAHAAPGNDAEGNRTLRLTGSSTIDPA